MRRTVAVVGLLSLATTFGTGGVAALPGYAEPTPAPTPSATAARGTQVCAIHDSRLVELSGIATTANGFVVINDGSNFTSRNKVFTLDSSCRVSSRVGSYPSPGQRDPEDVAIGSDGSIWVADIGDDPANPRRSTIALWKFPPDLAGKATLYRLKYPDGPHDAEALLLGSNDVPIVVTKNIGAAGIYLPTGPLTPSSSPSQAVPMAKVGEFTPQRTGTSTPSGLFGQLLITGGATSPDRKKVALRTYSDAYEWDVPDGDVVKAITTTQPRVTPLPDEPQGEAITYSHDGAFFFTVSETVDLPGDQLPTILRYRPVGKGTGDAASGGGGDLPAKRDLSWYERISYRQLLWLIAGVGGVGLLFMLLGVVGILRARRGGGKQAHAGGARDNAPADGDDTEQMLAAVGAEGYAGGGMGYAGDYGGYQPAGYSTVDYAAGADYSAGGYAASGGYAAGGYSAGGRPTGTYAASSYPAGGYSASGYPAGGYPTDSYPPGARAAPGYPEAGYGPDQYDGYDPRGY